MENKEKNKMITCFAEYPENRLSWRKKEKQNG
jgi:hypothetical protein